MRGKLGKVLNPVVDRRFGSALDRLLARARRTGARRVLLFWNRGLGDLALGLCPLFGRIRREIAHAAIEVLTREELREPFMLLDVDAVHVLSGLERTTAERPRETLARCGLDLSRYDVVLDFPDVTRWVAAMRPLPPIRLRWRAEMDARAARFALPDRTLIGVHVNTETRHIYGFVKDWPAPRWQALFDALGQRGDVGVVLFGHAVRDAFSGAHLVDLRGRTSFLDVLSILKNRCAALVAPDSGILTTLYFLDASFPHALVSLWSDPRVGVLGCGQPSPNPRLVHVPLRAPDETLAKLPVDDVLAALGRVLDAQPAPAST